MDIINKITVNGTPYQIGSDIDTSELMKIAVTLDSVPGLSTLSYNDTPFVVGDVVRVADQTSTTGYSFYRLHDINNGEAIWAKLETGTVDDSARVTVTMNSNQNEEFSGSVTITYGTTIETLIGSQVIFNVPSTTSYTLTFNQVNGYATPTSV